MRIEDLNDYVEPPYWYQSMRLYLGSALLISGDFHGAESTFRQDLSWHQDNGWALYGLYESLIRQGKSEQAAIILRAFKNAWSEADIALSSNVVFLNI